MEKRLKYSERQLAMGSMAGGMTYELMTILGEIQCHAEAARATAKRSVATRQYLENIINSSHRARLIINRILAMDREAETPDWTAHSTSPPTGVAPADLGRQLNHAEHLQTIGATAGTIAHDFNNILGAILGYAEMAQVASRRTVATRQSIGRIIHASHRARLIVDHIAAMSRKRDRLVHPINVAEAIAAADPLLRMILSIDIALTVQIAAADAVIHGNPFEIQQILLNICRNAAEALGGTGAISINVTGAALTGAPLFHTGPVPAGDYVKISVADNAGGIPASVLPHILEPFFTTKAAGSGLGLAAVLDYTNTLGGFIDVTSTSGEGTRFDIYLPRSQQQAVDLSIFSDEKKVHLGHGEIIAIVEAASDALEKYEDMVAALSYEPIGFHSFAAFATWLAAGNEPDLLLLDAALAQDIQDLDGPDPLFGKRPLVIIGNPQDTSLARLPAATSFLKKPFPAKDLANVLHKRIG